MDIILNLLVRPLFNIPFFSGLIFILAGAISFAFPPKSINSLYGYRTNSSMQSQEKWDFAQRYSSKLMMKLGLILSCTSALSLLSTLNEFINMFIGLALMIFTAVILLVKVENAIRNKFG